MKWSLAELHRYQDEPLHIQSTFDLNASLTKLFPDIILAVQPVKVDGYVTYDVVMQRLALMLRRR